MQGGRDGSDGPSHQMSQGLKQRSQRREPAEKARRKVQVGLFVGVRVESLVSTTLPTSFHCLRLKWESVSTLQLTPHLSCNLTLRFRLFLPIHQFMAAQGREHSLPLTCTGPSCDTVPCKPGDEGQARRYGCLYSSSLNSNWQFFI